MEEKTYEPHTEIMPDLPLIFHITTLYAGRLDLYLHWHENIELLYLLEGSLEITIDTVIHTASAGDLIVINSNHLHKARALTPKCSYYCLIADSRFCEQSGLPTAEIQLQSLICDEEIRPLFEIIKQELSTKQTYYKSRIKFLVLELMIYLYRNYAAETSLRPVKSKTASVSMVKNSIRFMRQKFAMPLSLETIAQSTGFSKFYFSRTFKEVTGMTVNEYVNILRCGEACRLLRTGNYNVNEAAALSGFTNMSYFSKTYRKIIGKLPSEELNEILKNKKQYLPAASADAE